MKSVALIGVGGHGQSHLDSLRHFEKSGEVRLVAVADPAVEKLVAEHTALTGRGVRWHRDYRDLLRKEGGLDAVVICTPIHLHEPMVRDALQQSRASILIEKPAFPTPEQIERFAVLDKDERVRVGFQMIHLPSTLAIKQALRDGRAGRIRRIIISAGWPRGASYYERAPWAGRMDVDGHPVFDGPATNALLHLLHNALFFAGKKPGGFAVPRRVTGELYRARRIESYDMIWAHAELDDCDLHLALAHCVRHTTPFCIRIETDRGHMEFRQENDQILHSPEIEIAQVSHPPFNKFPLYQSFLAGTPGPTTLRDAHACALLAAGALASSGGIHDIPAGEVEESEGILNVRGLTSYLDSFLTEPKPPREFGFTWGKSGALQS